MLTKLPKLPEWKTKRLQLGYCFIEMRDEYSILFIENICRLNSSIPLQRSFLSLESVSWPGKMFKIMCVLTIACAYPSNSYIWRICYFIQCRDQQILICQSVVFCQRKVKLLIWNHLNPILSEKSTCIKNIVSTNKLLVNGVRLCESVVIVVVASATT